MLDFPVDAKLRGQAGWHCIDVIEAESYRQALEQIVLKDLAKIYEHKNSVYVDDIRVSSDDSARRSLIHIEE